VIEAPSDYVRRCFAEYGMKTDASGRYGAMYKPYHLIGLELGISVANIMLRGEATGAVRDFRGDAVATAKRALKAGETLDGEGGFMVYGKLMPASASLSVGGLPIGLAHGLVLRRALNAGETVCWSDVTIDVASDAVRLRREMEDMFRPDQVAAPALAHAL
jgi:predicted homoserine dehydrogenase-like protein